MKSRTKVFFYLLFVPYILLIISGVISAFCGVIKGFFGDQSLMYGADAFVMVVLFALLGAWYIWAFCFIAQIVLLVIEKVRNKGAIKNCLISMVIVYIILTLLGYVLSVLIV